MTDAAASPNTTTFAYDAAGNRTLATDALLRDTVFVHDPLGAWSRCAKRASLPR